jgi:DNA modification methylase
MRSIYKTQKIELFHGDALDGMIELALNGIVVDATITDPPYSSGGLLRSDRMRKVTEKYEQTQSKRSLPTFEGDHRDQRSYLAWSHLWLSYARAITKPGGDLFSFIDWRQLPTLSDAIQSAGYIWKNVGIWHKKFGRPLKGTFSGGHEFILHGVNGPREAIERYAPSVFTENTPSDKVHLSQKPVVVMEWIMGLTAPDALILDPFAGSGSTLIAAKNTGRRAIGIEADPTHLETIVRRLEETPDTLND